MANTKLTREQKDMRKRMIVDLNNHDGQMADVEPFTVAKMPEFPGSRMALFSVAVCSDNELKFRRKVGEFIALTKLSNGNYIVLPNSISAYEFAESLANMLEESVYPWVTPEISNDTDGADW